jgi:hypothetical protein
VAPLTKETAKRVEFLDEKASRDLFDELAQRQLGISGQEFKRRWERGDYRHDPDRPEVALVAMLRHLAD